MANNKIIYGDETLIDLTDASMDIGDEDKILATHSAYGRGGLKITGMMPDRSGHSGTITLLNEVYDIEEGYHDGTGEVQISATEKAKIIPENIKDGVQILGVTGTLSAGGNPEITVSYLTSSDTIQPGKRYVALSPIVSYLTCPKIMSTDTGNMNRNRKKLPILIPDAEASTPSAIQHILFFNQEMADKCIWEAEAGDSAGYFKLKNSGKYLAGVVKSLKWLADDEEPLENRNWQSLPVGSYYAVGTTTGNGYVIQCASTTNNFIDLNSVTNPRVDWYEIIE